MLYIVELGHLAIHNNNLKELFVIVKFKVTSIISVPHMWGLSSHSPPQMELYVVLTQSTTTMTNMLLTVFSY